MQSPEVEEAANTGDGIGAEKGKCLQYPTQLLHELG